MNWLLLGKEGPGEPFSSPCEEHLRHLSDKVAPIHSELNASCVICRELTEELSCPVICVEYKHVSPKEVDIVPGTLNDAICVLDPRPS